MLKVLRQVKLVFNKLKEMIVFAYILLPLGSHQIAMSISSAKPVVIISSEGKPQVNIECPDNSDYEGKR